MKNKKNKLIIAILQDSLHSTNINIDQILKKNISKEYYSYCYNEALTEVIGYLSRCDSVSKKLFNTGNKGYLDALEMIVKIIKRENKKELKNG